MRLCGLLLVVMVMLLKPLSAVIVEDDMHWEGVDHMKKSTLSHTSPLK